MKENNVLLAQTLLCSFIALYAYATPHVYIHISAETVMRQLSGKMLSAVVESKEMLSKHS